MSVVLDVGLEETASIKEGVWTSESDALVEILSIFTQSDIETYVPWIDHTIAEMAAEALGGKIIEATDQPIHVRDRVY